MVKTEPKTPSLEREYIIPLRKEWQKVANYRRTGRAVKAIKKFIARHMKIPDRDISKVKLDMYLNNEIWFRGKKKPPAKIKVKAIKEGDIIKVELAEVPAPIKSLKLKHEKRYKKAEEKKPEVPKKEKKEEEKPEEKTEEEKKEEKEKSTSAAEQKAKQAEVTAKAQKQTQVKQKVPTHRKALKK